VGARIVIHEETTPFTMILEEIALGEPHASVRCGSQSLRWFSDPMSPDYPDVARLVTRLYTKILIRAGCVCPEFG